MSEIEHLLYLQNLIFFQKTAEERLNRKRKWEVQKISKTHEKVDGRCHHVRGPGNIIDRLTLVAFLVFVYKTTDSNLLKTSFYF